MVVPGVEPRTPTSKTFSLSHVLGPLALYVLHVSEYTFKVAVWFLFVCFFFVT